jgi:hypothetical protein
LRNELRKAQEAAAEARREKEDSENRWRAAQEAAEAEAKRLRAELSAKEAATAQLAAQLSDSENRWRKTHEETQGEARRLREELGAKEALLTTASQQTDGLANGLRNELRRANEEAAEVSKRLRDDLSAKDAQLTDSENRWRKEEAKLAEELRQAREELKEQAATKVRQAREREESENRWRKEAEQFRHFEAECDRLAKRLSDLQFQSATELAEISTRAARAETALKNRDAEFRQTLAEKEREATARLREALETAGKRFAEAEAREAELANRLREAQGSESEKQRDSANRLRKAEDELRERQAQCEALAARLAAEQEKRDSENRLQSEADKKRDSENRLLAGRVGALSGALELAKEQRAAEKEKAEEASARLEEAESELRVSENRWRKAEETLGKQREQLRDLENRLRKAEEGVASGKSAERALEAANSANVSHESIISSLRARVATLESTSAERDALLAAAEQQAKVAASDFGKCLAKIAELETQLAAPRDAARQTVGGILERHLFLCRARDEFDAADLPVSANRLHAELGPLILQNPQMVGEIARAVSDFCAAEGQSLSVLFHVCATLLGVAKKEGGNLQQHSANGLRRVCRETALGPVLSACVGSVLASWEKAKHLPNAAGKKNSSPVPVAGAAAAGAWKACLEAMAANRLPNAVISGVCGSLANHLNRLVFNRIVRHAEFCTFASGFQLKVELAHLSEFMYAAPQNVHLRQYHSALAHVTEASSLLTISKVRLFFFFFFPSNWLQDILTDKSILESAFPNLNARQIRQIICQYRGEGPGDVIAPAVLAYFERAVAAKDYPLELSPETANKLLADIVLD